MRHGRDFRCSRRNCEKVFPSRESLRAHIHAHFFGGGATPGHSAGGGDGREEQFQAVLCAASCPASPSVSVRQRHPPAPSAPPPSAQSPGVPEESHTTEQLHNHATMQSHSSPPSVASSCFASGNGAGGGGGMASTPKGTRGVTREQQASDAKVSTVGFPSSLAVATLLNCQFCGAQLADVQALQTHWLQQHVAQLARPHICVDCDAGFTTAEALRAHRELQHADETARNAQRISAGQN
uniref:C2H2-type domain-containing protein n=1 Tax=Globodera pallida TaxID=36090 RepID=A0A183CS88_GLOPA